MTKEEFDNLMEKTFGDRVINIPSEDKLLKPNKTNETRYYKIRKTI